jgi:nitroreductase/NAD-dependent dihydropyrimidine dehydrogenase PreA subunit
MGLLKIDQSKCKKDGICAASCPAGIIRLQQDGGGIPEMVPGGDTSCIVCGHCVAVCPHGALDHEKMPIESCPPIERDLKISEEQAVQFLRSRRSIRAFRDQPVEEEKLRKLIEIGRYAPTGSNTQLVEWIACTDKSKIRQWAGMTVEWMRNALENNPASVPFSYAPLIVAAWDMGIDAVLRSAPALVVAIAPEEAGNGMVDLSLALCYLELVAPKLGLGTCWGGMLRRGLANWPDLRASVGIPEGYPHFYPMMLGYPTYEYHRMPERKPPKITWR